MNKNNVQHQREDLIFLPYSSFAGRLFFFVYCSCFVKLFGNLFDNVAFIIDWKSRVYFTPRVGQYRGTKAPRYCNAVLFSTVIGIVGTFQKMYRFWYRRYVLDRFLDISVIIFE